MLEEVKDDKEIPADPKDILVALGKDQWAVILGSVILVEPEQSCGGCARTGKHKFDCL